MDANIQLALVEILERLPADREKDAVAFVRKVFAARRTEPLAKPAPKTHAYAAFTREMMPKVRADFPNASNQDLMRIVAKAWAAQKASGGPAGGGVPARGV